MTLAITLKFSQSQRKVEIICHFIIICQDLLWGLNKRIYVNKLPTSVWGPSYLTMSWSACGRKRVIGTALPLGSKTQHLLQVGSISLARLEPWTWRMMILAWTWREWKFMFPAEPDDSWDTLRPDAQSWAHHTGSPMNWGEGQGNFNVCRKVVIALLDWNIPGIVSGHVSEL